MSIVHVNQIKKAYQDKTVLDGVSFQIHEPEIIALVGPNGSGKSTLMNIMMNLVDPDSGEVKIFGRSPKDYRIFDRVAFLKDNTVLYPYLSGWDHLEYACHIYRLKTRRAQQLVEEMGMGPYVRQPVSQYSLGMKQHLLLALAILNNPDFILMDEPLNGLDPTSVIRVRQLLLDLHGQGTTILLSSHTLSEVDAVTRHILFLKDGRLIEEWLDADLESGKKSTEARYLEIFAGGS